MTIKKVAKQNFAELETLIRQGKGSIESLKNLDKNTLELRDLTTLDSLMHIAARVGNLEAAKLLHSKEIGLSQLNKEGYMPIHTAAFNDKVDLLEWMLSKDSSLINKRNDENYTPLEVAAWNSSINSMIFILKNSEKVELKHIDPNQFIDLLLGDNPEYEHYFAGYDQSGDQNHSKLIGILEHINQEPE